jgi:glycosyltransferase involved in cell wall biosynthesis
LTPLLWVFVGIAGIQILYWSVFLFGLSRDKKTGGALNIPVSVIVCAHDEEENLRELLPLLLNQNHPDYEIIFVNDRSNDGTYDWLLAETKKETRLKMVNVTNKPDHINGKKFALTLGIKAAKHDWVLLTDADCRPSSNEWIPQMAGSFTEGKTMVLGYSPYQSRDGFLNAFIRFETLVTAVQYFAFALLGKPYMGVGRNLAYRKKLFLENKGFSQHLSVTGGDDDLFINQYAEAGKVAVALQASAHMISKPKIIWAAYWQQKIRHLAVGKFYSLRSKLMLAPFTLSWALFWPMAFVVFPLNLTLVSSILLVRWLTQMMTVFRFTAQTGERQEAWKLPFLDFIFGFYYLVAGFTALFTKRVKWKT